MNSTANKSKKVLICDDERHLVRLVRALLERQGHQVVAAFDGREALELIAAGKPDVVILDVMMPYVDGFEVLKKIRQNPDTKDIYVVMLTSRSQTDDIFRGYNIGADLYLTKPFDPIEIIRAL